MSLEAKTFFYPKLSGTHADSLAVAGLAVILSRIGPANTKREVVIEERGPYWTLSADEPVTDADIEAWDGDPFYPYIRLKGDKSPKWPGEIDYETERARRDEKRASEKAVKRTKTKGSPIVVDSEIAAMSEAAITSHRETDLLARFNQLRSGFKGDIELHRALRETPPRQAVKEQLLALSSVRTERSIPDDDVFDVSTSQWFLPIGGKGSSGLKPRGVAGNALPKHFANGFDAWLRCIGMYRALTVHTLGKDLRLAVLCPAAIETNFLTNVRDTLRDARGLWGRLADVRAPLALARALVENSEELKSDSGSGLRLKFAKRRPRDIIRGFDISTYKKMGTASALMNVAFLGTPSWAAIGSRADAQAFLETLDDLERMVATLDEEKDVALLRAMAAFVISGSLDRTLGFFSLDAATQMTRTNDQNRRRKPWRISETNLRRIVMGIDDGTLLQQIISDEGFIKVAKAVRAATVHAQLHDDSPLDARYGLAQSWRQHASFKDRFVQQLASFVASFNGEVARKREVRRKRGDPRPVRVAMVTEEDLASVIRLIEAPGSSSALVAHLLLAFGFAAVKKTGAEADTADDAALNQEIE